MAKKPFFKTGVGSVLKGVASLIAPGLVNAIDGVENLQGALRVIGDSTESDEVKIKLRELALEQERIELETFREEVKDLDSAREREYKVLQAGGENTMMKVIGWGVTVGFIAMIASMLLLDIPEKNQRLFDIGFGAVSGMMGTIVAYFFGSSHKRL